MGNCGCGHCDCEDEKEPSFAKAMAGEEENECDCGCEHGDKSTKEKLDSLKKSIADLGYKVEENEEGEIKITQ